MDARRPRAATVRIPPARPMRRSAPWTRPVAGATAALHLDRQLGIADRGWPHVLRDLLLVAAGGALGAMMRFGASTVLPRLTFPWATLAVNLTGSFLLGFLFLDHGLEHSTRLLIGVGFLGAFTTLSTFSVETVELWREGHARLATLNAVLNGVAGPLMALAGWRVRLSL